MEKEHAPPARNSLTPATEGTPPPRAHHTLETRKAILCWGVNNYGQLGDGTTIQREVPASMPYISQAKLVAISTCYRHNMTLLSDGSLRAWGYNGYGQLGDGTTTDRLSPVIVDILDPVHAVATGFWHSVALSEDGGVHAWGHNEVGQLGDGTGQSQKRPVTVPDLSNVAALAAGAEHTLALLHDGTVQAWGRNSCGQLGDGTTTNRWRPVAIPGLVNVEAIAAAAGFSLALLRDGTVAAWGYNRCGQWGDDQSTSHLQPTPIPGLTNVTAIAAAGYDREGFSLALLDDGTVRAWGYNTYGQLGDGTTIHRSTPVPVAGLADVTAIAAGGYEREGHGLALLSDGSVRTWGYNHYGQLGDGTCVDQLRPVTVPGLSGVTSIAAGGWHNVVLTHVSRVDSDQRRSSHRGETRESATAAPLRLTGPRHMWGANSHGQLGDGTTEKQLSPVGMPYLSQVEFVAVAARYRHNLVLLSNGTVQAWGSNRYGQLGDGAAAPSRTVPIVVSGLTSVKAIAAGYWHSLAVTEDGSVHAWGRNKNGHLGDGTNLDRPIPGRVPDLHGVIAVAAGAGFSLALLNDGTIQAWGRNGCGQLGDGSTVQRLSPVPVAGITNARAIAAGAGFSLALLDDGTVWSWGDNENGPLGDGSTSSRSVPAPIRTLTNARAIVAGPRFALAIHNDGTVWGWGDNENGQLGDGTITERLSPVPVAGLANARAIAAGGYDREGHVLALLDDGTVHAWGGNEDGELGDGSTTPRSVPKPVPGLTGIKAVAAGGWHSLAYG